jgi:serine/threonine-protein kinase
MWLGSYRVLEKLGAGGMGEVYLVEEAGTGIRRAMKTLRSSSRQSEDWMRFMNEGEVHHELRHPNITAFHEMFLCDGRPCMVMEYVDGETLYARIRRAGPLAVEDALAVTSSICAALEYLHERGVLHRDLKSANVKITSAGVVKLLDFGIAKRQRARGLTVEGTVIGTPEYLAPEQLSGAPPDVRSEIWALGLLMYEMTTGRLPFTGDEAALYAAIRGTVPPPPSAWNAAVPPEVDSVVMRCLEKRPSRRFQAVSEVRWGTPAASGFAQRLREKLWRK